MKRGAESQRHVCPVCNKVLDSEGAKRSHLRDKRDEEHETYRNNCSEPQTVVKRPRTDSTEPAHSAGEGSKTAEDATAGDADNLGAIPQGPTRALHSLVGAVTDTASKASAFIQKTFSRTAEEAVKVGSEAKPHVSPAGDARAMQGQQLMAMQGQQLTRECLQNAPGNFRAAGALTREGPQNAPRQLQVTGGPEQQGQQVYLKEHAQRIQAKLRAEIEALRLQNISLRGEMDEWRAARSAAAPGNDNINANFPFKKEIMKSYKKLCDSSGMLWGALLDPCLDVDDIPWACAVSKDIFVACQAAVEGKVLQPRNIFKEAVMAGTGADEVPEWEDARWTMIKLQRATRTRLLSQLETGAVQWVSELREKKEGALGRLMLHEGYKTGACEKCIAKLLQVTSCPASAPMIANAKG